MSIIMLVYVSLDCKTEGFFFSKSVKKSVKRGVRVLRSRSARALHNGRVRREKKNRIFSVSGPSLALCF